MFCHSGLDAESGFFCLDSHFHENDNIALDDGWEAPDLFGRFPLIPLNRPLTVTLAF
jgi:hypothetical protein